MHSRVFLIVALIGGCKLAKDTDHPAGKEIAIAPAAYGENARPPDKSCKFDQELTESIADAIPGGGVDSGATDRLTVTITRVQGAEVGWQGDINVIVEGQLSGVETRSFRFKRGAPPGIMGGKRGVCTGLKNVADILADDIAAWVAAGEEKESQTATASSDAPSERHEENALREETPPPTSEARDVALDEFLEE